MHVGVVIPVGPGRKENLQLVLERVVNQGSPPGLVVLVCDGPESHIEVGPQSSTPVPIAVLDTPKHEPGMEQPRNIGVRLLTDLPKKDDRFPEFTHVWFLDTDILIGKDCLEHFHKAQAANEERRIMVGPYDWLPPGVREPMPELKNDPRWISFDDAYPWEVEKENLAAGLACFSGNLMWPMEDFRRVGGFWDEMHHGRCEDGELGLRAVAMGMGISFIPEARGWHLYHDFDAAHREKVNSIDVPKINKRHAWKELPDSESDELFVVEEDGRRFNVRCGNCGEEFNSALIWAHKEECHKKKEDEG